MHFFFWAVNIYWEFDLSLMNAVSKREELQANDSSTFGWGWWGSHIWSYHSSSEEKCTLIFSSTIKRWPLACWECWPHVLFSSFGHCSSIPFYFFIPCMFPPFEGFYTIFTIYILHGFRIKKFQPKMRKLKLSLFMETKDWVGFGSKIGPNLKKIFKFKPNSTRIKRVEY